MTYDGTDMTVGDDLAAARRQAGLTITQVSQRTCIRETIVRGIERGDYSACGGDFYARGHVRSIARAVGLDPWEMVARYDATHAPPPPITAADVFQPFTPVKLRERRRPNWTALLAAGLVVIAGLAVARYVTTRHHTAHPVSAAQAHRAHRPVVVTPSASPAPAAQSSPAATRVQVMIVAHKGNVTWAQLTAQGGRVLFQGDIGTGTSVMRQTFSTGHGMTVQLGNPQGADLYLNGKKVPDNRTEPVTLTCTIRKCA